MSDTNMQGQYAGFISRATGLIIDLALIYLFVIAVAWLTHGALSLVGIDISNCPDHGDWVFPALMRGACNLGKWLVAAFAALAPTFYFVLLWSLGGQTIGDYTVGVKIVRSDGGDVGFLRALIRWGAFLLCVLTLGIGFLWVVIDDRREGWHDKLAHTCVVYAWQARQNETLVDKVRRWVHDRQVKRDAKGAS